jgi:hypothetical protein
MVPRRSTGQALLCRDAIGSAAWFAAASSNGSTRLFDPAEQRFEFLPERGSRLGSGHDVHPHLISKTVTEVIQIEVRAWRWCPAITCGSGAICIPAGATVRVEDDPRLKHYSSNAGGFNLQPRSSGISRMSPFPANQGGNFRPEAASPSIGFVRCGRSRISRTSSSLLRPNAPGAALAGRFSRSL